MNKVRIKTINLNGEDIPNGGVISCTRNELKAKRDAGELIVGGLYRITDYVATTIQYGTRSANHPFDLIVTAVSEKELDEHAIAIQNEETFDGIFINDGNHWAYTGKKFTLIGQDGTYENMYRWLAEGYEDGVTGYYSTKPFDAIEGQSDKCFSSFIDIGDGWILDGDTIRCENQPVKSGEWESANSLNAVLSLKRYFDGFKLTAWDILYTIDNDDRYTWALTDKIDTDNDVHWRRPFFDKEYEGEKYYAYWSIADALILYAKKEIRELETVQLYDNNFDEYNEIEVTDYIPSTGKGVIYHMVDEFGNERQFDFKGIQFLRDEAWCDAHEDWVNHEFNGISKDWWLYALSWINYNDIVQDLSLVGNNGTLTNDEKWINGCFDTKVGKTSAYYIYEIDGLFSIDRVTMVYSYYYDNGLFYACYNNILGNDCFDCTFGSDCHNVIFGDRCNNVVIPQNVHDINVLSGVNYETLTDIEPNADYCQFVGLDSQGNVKVWNPADIANVVGGVTINLSAFDLYNDETDVTSAIPAGYVPKIGDIVIYNGNTMLFTGSYRNQHSIGVTFGLLEPELEGFNSYKWMFLIYNKQGHKWHARFREL